MRLQVSLPRSVSGVLLLAMLVTAASMSSHAKDQLRLALDGYDPVAYITEGRPTLGKPEFEIPFDEARYRFATERNLSKFRKEPDRYLPQFNGICAMGLGAKGYKVVGDPNNWIVDKGRLFVTQSAVGLHYFSKDPDKWALEARTHAKALEDAPIGSGLSWW